VVIGAMGLELFGGDLDMGAATDKMLLWTGIVALVVGAVFGVTQRNATPLES
jgi:hypothetical protein